MLVIYIILDKMYDNRIANKVINTKQIIVIFIGCEYVYNWGFSNNFNISSMLSNKPKDMIRNPYHQVSLPKQINQYYHNTTSTRCMSVSKNDPKK